MKLAEKVKSAIEETNEIFNSNFVVPELKANVKDLEAILAFLYEKKDEEKVEFVSGKGKENT